MASQRASRHRNWCYTYQLPTEETKALFSSFETHMSLKKEEIKEHGFQLEHAPTTGKPHVQGYIVFWNAKSLSSVRSIFPVPDQVHLEVMRKGLDASRKYCSKKDTAVDGTSVQVRGKDPDLERLSVKWSSIIRQYEAGKARGYEVVDLHDGSYLTERDYDMAKANYQYYVIDGKS